jgi:signal transduction histidine kinase
LEEKTSFTQEEVTVTDQPNKAGTRQRWHDSITKKTMAFLPGNQVSRGIRSPHFWVIAALMVILSLIYYAGYTPLAQLGNFFTNDFPHDLHRTLFLIPIIYASIAFRVRGALVTSSVFLCVMLPRTFYSPYADPLGRPLLFVLFTASLGVLAAMLIDQVEKERKAHAELNIAHQELSAYVRKLEESQEQLIRAEKLTSLGQLAASIAHEINNPLAGVLVYTQLLSKKVTGNAFKKEEALSNLSKMETEISRCSRIIRNLLDFARQTEPMLRLVDVNQVIEQVLAMVGHQAQLQKVEVVQEFSPSLPKVMADFDQLQQIFTNLSLNAIQAMPEGGKLTVRSSAVDSEVRVDVQDTGCGISKENMSKLFTPFFTTKVKGKGVGLGLAVVHGIIERHKGRIEVQSEVGNGTTFSVYLAGHEDEKS